MRINEIEIKNFRAFYGTYKIDLHSAGQNLLVYGENGSGKSSLALALKLFVESSSKDHNFLLHKNIFVRGSEDDGYIKLHLQGTPYEWTTDGKTTNVPVFIEASKTKGFLDYKSLLETYFLQREQDTVNIFNLLVNNILANSVNDITGKTFREDWIGVQDRIPKRNYERHVGILSNAIDRFNNGLRSKLEALKSKASEVLARFECDVELNFLYDGVFYKKETKTIERKEILIRASYFRKDVHSHHHFLNEARLSAIAISIYFASLLLNPSSDLRILILDDVLIGLDMSNCLPVLDIMRDFFAGYQVFFFTYDKAWYEIVKQRTQGQSWKYVELYYSKTDEYELPVYAEDKAYLQKAKEYFAANDYKASIVYLRAAFEQVIKRFCKKKKLKVKYHESVKELTSEDLWEPIKNGKHRGGAPYLDVEFIAKLELCRSIILNPLSHSRITETYRNEINDAITVVEELTEKLRTDS